MRSSDRIAHNSATATDGSSPSLAGKKGFWGNNRAVNWRRAGLGDSWRDISAEQSVSSGITNPRDCRISYEEFATYSCGFGNFSNFYRRGDSDCEVGCKEFAGY